MSSLQEETAVTAKSMPQGEDEPPPCSSPAQTQHISPVHGWRGVAAQQGQCCHWPTQTPKRTGVLGSCPWWEHVIPAPNPASIPHSCPCGRGRQEQGVSDGAVRAQRWYLQQRPCCYCCEGCWQIALSRSISMKDEISASCENFAPQGLRGWVSSGPWEPLEISWDALGQN